MKPNGSFIFTVLGCAGVLGTAFIAAKNSKKHCRKLDEYYSSVTPDSEPLKLKEEIKLVWKCYIPTIAISALTIGSVVLSHRLSAKQIVGLTTALGYFTANRDRLSRKIEEFANRDVLHDIRKEIAEDEWTPGVTVEETGNGDLLCFEGYSGRWFRSSFEAVKEGIAEFSCRFMAGEYLSLNDLYECLDIEKTHFGNQWGWPANPDYYDKEPDIEAAVAENFIDKYKTMTGKPVCLIDIYTYPMEAWMEV